MLFFCSNMAAVLLALCLATSSFFAAGLQQRDQLVLRGAAKDPYDDFYAHMRKIMEGNLGDKKIADDLVKAVQGIDHALDETIAKAKDENQKKALVFTQEAYKNNLNSWSKMKKEFFTSSKVREDAMKSGILQLWFTAAAIRSGEPVRAMGEILGFAGAISMAIPGGQIAGLTFSLIGIVAGIFAPFASPGKSLTLEGITTAVQGVVRAELNSFAADASKLSILTDCNRIKADISSIYIDLNFLTQNNYDDNSKRGYLREQVKIGLEKIKTQITNVVKIFSDIDTSIEQNVIVNMDPAKASCSDACALMTVPYDRWIKDPSNINYVYPSPSMRDNYRSFWTPSNIAYWYPCPVLQEFSKPEFGEGEYKACIYHHTGIPRYNHGKCKHGCRTPHCTMNDDCKRRVDNIKVCRAELNDSQRLFKGLSKTLQCGMDRAIALQSLVATIAQIGALYDNFPLLDQSFPLMVKNLNEQMQQVNFYMTYRNPAIAAQFSFDGKKTYNCFDPSKSWVEAFGVKTFSGARPIDDVENTYLRNGPCSTNKWMEKVSYASAYKDDKFRCDGIQDGGPAPNWKQVNPFYDYKALIKAQWKDEFKMQLA